MTTRGVKNASTEVHVNCAAEIPRAASRYSSVTNGELPSGVLNR
jgi:hypothetical protein